MSNSIKYNPKSLESTIEAAQQLVDGKDLYIIWFQGGFTIQEFPPFRSKSGVRVGVDGSLEVFRSQSRENAR